MPTIIINSSSPASFTPQEGDIYIIENDAQGTFTFLGDADFEVRIEDAGPYSQGTGQVTLSFEDTTNPTVIYANGVDAQRVGLNANGDSLTVNAGDNVTLGPIIGSGEERIPSMPSGDGLNADGGGLTITTGSGTIVTSTIDGPSSGADANYTFGEGNEFWTGATVTGSVGGNTTIVVGDNAVVSANAGFVAPLGDLNGNTQSITIGNNAVNDPGTQPAWEVTVAGTNGEKIIDIGDNVTVGEVGFGSEGTVSNANGFDNNTTFVNPTGGTLTAGENLTVTEFIWGTEGGSTYILGDGWDVPFDLSGAGENNGDDPADKLILGEPAIQGGDTGVLIGSGNDQISIMPPTSSPAETAAFIDSATAAQWAENDDGSWSPTIANSNDLVYDMGIYTFGAGSPGPAPNQIVDGENDAEFMGDGYDDANGPTNSGGDIIDGADGDNDVILGNGGNDTINAGAGTDEVYGGSGNDVIDGGAGNDTLTGDFASDVTDTVVDNSTVEGDDILEGGAGDDVIYGDSGNSLSAGGEGVPGDTLGDGPGSTGGGYDRVSAQSVYNGNHTFSTDAFYLGNDIPVLDDANRDAITGVSFSQDGEGTDRSFGLDELTFTGAQRSFVGLVTVQDSDVSGANDQFSSSISGGFQDTTVVSSGTADFTMNDGQVFEGIRVNFVRGPDGETYMMPDDGPSPFAFNSFRNMLATNDSGIDSFTIATGSGDDAGINPIEGNWADGQFLELTEGDGGDDTIIGGEGADTMFGEGGDDTFIVGSAAEGAGDVISGGNGPDETTDNDVLDLRGAGPVTITQTADGTDDGATTGTVTFADGSTLQFSQIETILTDPVDVTPDAVDDVATTDEDTTVTIDVLANDTDPNGDPLTVTDASVPPEQGTVAVVENQILFTPAPDFNGEATITYTISDTDRNTDTATVTVTVAPVEDAPVAEDDAADTLEDTPVTIDVLANDTDADGQPLTVTEATAPNGTVAINPDGTLTYTPDPDFNGEDVITYTVTDPDGNEDTAEVTVTIAPVEDTPVANPDVATVEEGDTVVIDALANDTDPDTAPEDLEIIAADAPNGTVDFNPDGTLTYEPDFGFVGEDTITYTVTDPEGNTATSTVTVTVTPTPGSDDPVAVADEYDFDLEGYGGGTIRLSSGIDGVLSNDSDPNGDPLTVVEVNGSPILNQWVDADNGGQIRVAPNGSVRFRDVDGDFDTLPDGEVVQTSVSYTVSDGNGGTDTVTVTINVTGAAVVEDTSPDAVDDIATATAGEATVIDVLANDSDPDNALSELVVTASDTPNGIVDVNPDGTITYEPDFGFVGEDIITYTITDPDGNTDTATVTVTVSEADVTPVANPDLADVDEDDAVVIDVLANDTDPNGDPLTVTEATAPNGTVTINPDGTLSYTPDPDFNGEDVITYTVTDPDGNEDTSTVTVTVAPVEDAPVAEDDAADTLEDTPVTIDVLANDTDADGQPLTVTAATAPNGTVAINPDGTLSYTPDPDFNGEDVITYTVTDPDGNEDTAEVTVTIAPVEDTPVANPDLADVDEDDAVVIDVLANDTDPNGDPLTVTEATAPNGTVAINPDGTLSYTPDPDFNGEDVITYTVTDPDGNEDTSTVTVTVAPVEDAPVAEDDAADTLEDTPVTIDVLANDTDADGQPLTVTAATAPNGTVAINPDGTLTYTPDPDFNGEDVITYTVTDPDGNEDTAEVTVTIAPVEDTPVANPDLADVDEDDAVVIDVLANDTDPNGDPLTVTEATAPNGTVAINPDGTLSYTPDPDFNGEDVITYTVTDPDGNEATSTVTVTVAPVEDAPVAEDDAADTLEDTPVTIDVLANDTDADGQPLTVTEATAPNGTVAINPDGTLSYTPDPDFNGEDVITYTVTDPDGNEDTAEVTVTIAPVEDTPVANPDLADVDEDDAVVIDVLANDTDPNGDPLTVTEATAPNGTVAINPDGTLSYTPDPDFNGEDVITYTVTDPDGNEDTSTVTVTVAPVEDAPVAEDDAADTLEDTPVTIDVLANDTDADGQPLTVTEATAPNGTVAINPDGTLSYTPDPDFNGEDVITYTVTDPDGNEDTAEVTVTIAPVEDTPVANPDLADVDEDDAVVIDVLANDTDPNGDPLTVTEATAPNGTVAINPDGTLSYTPDPDFNGEDVITYTVTDPDGNEATSTVTVTVAPVEDAPVAEDDAADTLEDTPVTIDVLANDTDADGQPLTVTEATAPNGTVAINPDGTLSYTPDPDFNGEDVITYTVTDPDGNEDTAEVTVTIAPVEDTPVANPDLADVDEDDAVVIDVLANDTDPNGDPLTVTEATAPNGTVTINPDGTLSYTPDPDFNGEDVITYTVTDPDGNEDTSTVTVTVAPVEDAPVAEDDAADTLEDTPVTIDVLANDTDADGQPLTVTEATAPNGTVAINPDGTLSYTPDPDFNGEDVITYTVTDPDGNEDTGLVTVSVAPATGGDGTVHGTDGDDHMSPGYEDPQGDQIDGTDGDDDIIAPGDGDDVVDAGNGNDTILGGNGNDNINGGAGDDTYVSEDDSVVLVTVDANDHAYIQDLGDGAFDETINVENFVADETDGADKIKFQDAVQVDEVQGLTDHSTGFFFGNNGEFVGFGPENNYLLSDLLGGTSPDGELPAIGPAGEYIILSGDEDGQIGETSFSNFENISFVIAEDDGEESAAEFMASLSTDEVLDETMPMADDLEEEAMDF